LLKSAFAVRVSPTSNSYYPLQLSMQPREVEIIPYEHLWMIILQYLKQPRRRRAKAMDVAQFEM